MSSIQDGQASSLVERATPHAPIYAGLGGSPEEVPDIPITSVFLALYVVLGVSHITILLRNKGRGHKFIFNGALLGLCKIRIVTMALRIAWACFPRSVNLAIAANVFVYVGTIILYVTNWFFTQRIVRAQHAKFGWSIPYLVFHRLAEVFMVASLILLIIAAVWTSFTFDPEKLHIFRIFQLTGQTYFAVFCFAPMVVVGLSLLFPRHAIDKFGVGRLRINITILIVAVIILSIGQIFRCTITWLPPYLSRGAQGRLVPLRWYHSKASFYAFNFATEIMVLVLYAIVRVDLRFHVPNGSRMSGDYSARNSRVTINNIGTEKTLSPADISLEPSKLSPSFTSPHSTSSIFEDTHTLADSLRYPSPTQRIRHTSSRVSFTSTAGSQLSLRSPDRVTFVDSDAPPVPQIPEEWPLPTSPTFHFSDPSFEHNVSAESQSLQAFVHSSFHASSTPNTVNPSLTSETLRTLHPAPLSWTSRTPTPTQSEPILPSNPDHTIDHNTDHSANGSPASSFNPSLLTPDNRPHTPIIQSSLECKTCNGIIPIAYMQPDPYHTSHRFLTYELPTPRLAATKRDSGTQTRNQRDSGTQTQTSMDTEGSERGNLWSQYGMK